LEKLFGPGPEPVVTRAPGRANLIGEHTDYNEGYVLPFAVDRYTEVALRRRQDMAVHIYTAAFDDTFSLSLPLGEEKRRSNWADYIIGILREFSKLGPFPHGFDAVIVSDVPIGSGLSSSASLEVTFAVGLGQLYGFEIEGLELVKLCQRAENDFVGMPCGIMDQYIAYFAEPAKALLLDTRSLRARPVPLNLKDVRLLIIDSGVRRALASSGYAVRRKECEEATHWLACAFPEKNIRALRDVEREMLDKVRERMPAVLWKRALHVVEENARVLAAVEALYKDDFETLGELLYASHLSLRDFFEVSIPEIDFLVEWGINHGALGARLMGGGFGGATIHLIPAGIRDTYVKEIAQAYTQTFGKQPRILEVSPAPGAKMCNKSELLKASHGAPFSV
jgi:galactokinase